MVCVQNPNGSKTQRQPFGNKEQPSWSAKCTYERGRLLEWNPDVKKKWGCLEVSSGALKYVYLFSMTWNIVVADIKSTASLHDPIVDEKEF